MADLSPLKVLPPVVDRYEAASWQRWVSERRAAGWSEAEIVAEQLRRFLEVAPEDPSREAKSYRAYALAYTEDELSGLVRQTLAPYLEGD